MAAKIHTRTSLQDRRHADLVTIDRSTGENEKVLKDVPGVNSALAERLTDVAQRKRPANGMGVLGYSGARPALGREGYACRRRPAGQAATLLFGIVVRVV